MNRFKRLRSLTPAKTLGIITLLVACAPAFARHHPHTHDNGVGAVYTASNDPQGNEILVFERDADGLLTPGDVVPTGGLGTGSGLGNQGGVILSDNNRWLLAVNAGSNDVSVFGAFRDDIVLTDIVPSGGDMPVSVTMNGRLVYVLNAAGAGSIVGFYLDEDGELTMIPDSMRPLSGADMTGAAQIQFSPRGDFLVVTEKATNTITVFRVDRRGVPGSPVSTPSAGETPFGFAFADPYDFVVSEAFGGAPEAATVSSYRLRWNGGVQAIDALVPTTETAACWVAIPRSGRFAYTTNTGGGTVTGFEIERRWAALDILNADGVTADIAPDARPIDAAFSNNSRFLYVLNSGNQTIASFEFGRESGQLVPLETTPGLPAGANGLAAR